MTCAVWLAGWLTLPVQAADVPVDDAQGWLQRLVTAEQQHSYQGTFIYERNGSFSTHAIWHRVEPDGRVRERLLQLDGPAQEVLRLDGQPQCVSGSQAEQLAGGAPQAVRELSPAQLADHYDARLVGTSRVAGRVAVILALLPRDQHRYGIELHLDRQTGLPLKSLLLNDKGQLLERFQFTRLNSQAPLADEGLQPSANCVSVQLLGTPGVVADAWHAEWLPPGFSLLTAQQQPGSAPGAAVLWLMFGDGLARFSVFLEPLHGGAVEDSRNQLGPTVVVSRHLVTEAGGMMVTVVGEIPPGTAERVALAMRPGTEPKSP